MSSKTSRKKRTSSKKKIGSDCVKDSDCFTNYCYQNKCTSKTRSYDIIQGLNTRLTEHYNDLRSIKEEKQNLEELLDYDDNTVEENVKYIDDLEKVSEIIKQINKGIKDIQEQLKDDSSSKKSASVLSSRRDSRKKKTYECPICYDEIDDLNNSFKCPNTECPNGLFHMNCVKRFCEQTKKVESYNYNPGTNDRYSHQEYQVKAQCPSCFTDWTRVCNEVTSQNRSRNSSLSSGVTEIIHQSDDDNYQIPSDDSSIDELTEILDGTTLNEEDIETYRRNSDSPPWAGIPLDDPRNQTFHPSNPSNRGGKKKTKKRKGKSKRSNKSIKIRKK